MGGGFDDDGLVQPLADESGAADDAAAPVAVAGGDAVARLEQAVAQAYRLAVVTGEQALRDLGG